MRRRQRRGAGGWQGVVQRHVASGLSPRAFCEREGIAHSSFARWRRRLAVGDAAGAFVEVSQAKAERGGWEVEVVLPGGVVFRMRGSRDAVA